MALLFTRFFSDLILWMRCPWIAHFYTLRPGLPVRYSNYSPLNHQVLCHTDLHLTEMGAEGIKHEVLHQLRLIYLQPAVCCGITCSQNFLL